MGAELQNNKMAVDGGAVISSRLIYGRHTAARCQALGDHFSSLITFLVPSSHSPFLLLLPQLSYRRCSVHSFTNFGGRSVGCALSRCLLSSLFFFFFVFRFVSRGAARDFSFLSFLNFRCHCGIRLLLHLLLGLRVCVAATRGGYIYTRGDGGPSHRCFLSPTSLSLSLSTDPRPGT